jgi:hypothetical protein
VDGRVSHCINQILFLLCGLKEIHQTFATFLFPLLFSKGAVCALHRDNGAIRLRVTGYLVIDSNHILVLNVMVSTVIMELALLLAYIKATQEELETSRLYLSSIDLQTS